MPNLILLELGDVPPKQCRYWNRRSNTFIGHGRPGAGLPPGWEKPMPLRRGFEEARTQVLQGLACTQEAEYWIGIGMPTLPGPRRAGQQRAHRGREPSHRGTTHVHRARLSTRSSRTQFWDLATVASVQGNAPPTAGHLHAAHTLFTTSPATAYVQRTEQLAGQVGALLSP